MGTIRGVSFVDLVLRLVHGALRSFGARLALLAFGGGYLLAQELLHGKLMLFGRLVRHYLRLLLGAIVIHLTIVCSMTS